MKALLKYFKGYKKECVLGPLFKLLEATFELFIPLVVRDIVDIGIANRDATYIMQRCLLMALLGAIGLACSLTAQYFSAKAAVGFTSRVKQALFNHMQTWSYTEIDTQGTSTMITRMTSDMNQIQSGVNLTLRLFLRSPFIVFGAMIMAFTIDVKAAIVFVVVIPVLSVVVYGIMMLTIPLYRKVQSRLDQILGITRSNLTGVRVVRAFGKEEEEIENFQDNNAKYVKEQDFVGRISALMNPLTFAIINLGTAWLIWRGAVQTDLGIITQGQVIALLNYMSQILIELIKLANLIISITKALACADRVAGIFAVESSMEEGTKKLPSEDMHRGEIRFDQVALHYKNAGEETLKNISFEVKKGQMLGIIGGTGSGKTSLINMIPRFYDATEGEVSIHGYPVKEYAFKSLRDSIAVVPQKAVLFTGSIRANMKWGNPDATDEEIKEALRIAQALDFVQQKEGELDYCLAQGGRNLSGGQRQRLTIARALVKKPDILILDDSSSALDAVTDAALRKALKEMPNAPTIVVVSQRTNSISQADQILVLEDGNMVGLGTHEQLLDTCEVYQEIYYSQGTLPKKTENVGGAVHG